MTRKPAMIAAPEANMLDDITGLSDGRQIDQESGVAARWALPAATRPEYVQKSSAAEVRYAVPAQVVALERPNAARAF